MKGALVLIVGGILLISIVGGFSATPGPEPASATPNVSGIPSEYVRLYQAAGEQYGIDWAVLAAVGKVETNHGESSRPGWTNSFGCCAGPMQACVIDGCPGGGARRLSLEQAQAGTWRGYRVDGNRDGEYNPWDPADAIPFAAKLLKANGAPSDYRRALMAYNHSEVYVNDVLAQAEVYRGSIEVLPPMASGSVRARIVALAEASMTKHTGFNRYSQAGPTTAEILPKPPNRTDCSQWVRAIYLAVGVPDPGTTTYDQMDHGHMTSSPQPGDLMLTSDGDHVEIYIGNGETIGHGTPPIDKSRVEYFPGAFFMTYPGVD